MRDSEFRLDTSHFTIEISSALGDFLNSFSRPRAQDNRDTTLHTIKWHRILIRGSSVQLNPFPQEFGDPDIQGLRQTPQCRAGGIIPPTFNLAKLSRQHAGAFRQSRLAKALRQPHLPDDRRDRLFSNFHDQQYSIFLSYCKLEIYLFSLEAIAKPRRVGALAQMCATCRANVRRRGRRRDNLNVLQLPHYIIW